VDFERKTLYIHIRLKPSLPPSLPPFLPSSLRRKHLFRNCDIHPPLPPSLLLITRGLARDTLPIDRTQLGRAVRVGGTTVTDAPSLRDAGDARAEVGGAGGGEGGSVEEQRAGVREEAVRKEWREGGREEC